MTVLEIALVAGIIILGVPMVAMMIRDDNPHLTASLMCGVIIMAAPLVARLFISAMSTIPGA